MCQFCNPDADMRARTFYRSPGWFAVLASPPNLPGHAILAAESTGRCPTELSAEVLGGFDRALADVVSALRAHYAPRRVVFASLRLQDPHVHVHVFAVSDADEHAWRSEKGGDYSKGGRFFEFLGDQERVSRGRHEEERRRTGWSEEQQRTEHTTRLLPDVEGLRLAVAGS